MRQYVTGLYILSNASVTLCGTSNQYYTQTKYQEYCFPCIAYKYNIPKLNTEFVLKQAHTMCMYTMLAVVVLPSCIR